MKSRPQCLDDESSGVREGRDEEVQQSVAEDGVSRGGWCGRSVG